MQIVMILVPVMLILVALGVLLFSWAVRNGQYDDLDGPAHRILYDDDQDRIPEDARTPEQQDDKEKPEGASSGDRDRDSSRQ